MRDGRSIMTMKVSNNELLALEHKFWDAMKSKDGKTAAMMTAPHCVVVGAQGVSTIDRESMGKMTVEGKWTMKSYDFDDKSVQFQMLDDSTALIAYKVTEKLEVEGKPVTLE